MKRREVENVSRSGVPQKLTNIALCHINRHIQHDKETRRQSLLDITTQLQLSVSTRTLRTAIIEKLNLGHCIQRKRHGSQKNKRPDV